MLTFEDKIAKLCIDKYKSLKKTGKPGDNEWTVLAGIVLQTNKDSLSVISLATGTKCLSAQEFEKASINNPGGILSDCHAEILARRALWRFLYDQIDQLFSTGLSDLFFVDDNNKQIEFNTDIAFHFYCSQTPCGDCSIIPKFTTVHHFHDVVPVKVMKFNDEVVSRTKSGTIIKDTSIFINDIHRTGAKCVGSEKNQDLHLPGVNYHVTGPLRTKPGRGDPTLSLSCSDKMAKWNLLGLQGALLSLLIPTLKLQSVVIGANVPFSLEAMERGLFKRFNIDSSSLNIVQSSLAFIHLKNETRTHPCPSGIIWCAVQNRASEVTVEGRKQGATKNKRGSNLLVSRKELLQVFLNTVDRHPHLQTFSQHPKKITYHDIKQYSRDYQTLWNNLKNTSFNAWPIKSRYLQQF